jgi:hypothetical protein
MNHSNYDKILNGVDALQAEILRLKMEGVSVIEFSTRLNTKKSIFEFAKKELPLDPYIEGEKSWDALADSIGGGFEKFRTKGVVMFIRTDASLQNQMSSAVIEFIDILSQIKREQLSNDMKIYLCSA